jgi:hypothetical protein
MRVKSTILIMSVLLSTVLFAAQDLFEQLGSAIRSGDARTIAHYFNGNVDLTIVNQEEVYSKAQAEMVLKDFFSKNTPKNFSIIHQGVSKEGNKYAIGTLTTTQGSNFRTYFFVKESGGSAFIQELRFEK